ncbi:MAG: 6-pyruvoyl-tetrahydropterin synthase-related protein, partial [Chloroflexota bacterium]|nr:6-pyruvoyl-tetrahydropterin synthase-related protein [Chloroflexota bacterium]
MNNVKKAVSKRRFIPKFWITIANRLWLLLPLLAIPALWPFYAEGLPRSNDGGLHLLRVGLLDFHLRHDTLFPRWAPEMLVGYGYPVFGSYAPSTYYLVEAFHLLGLSFYHAFITVFVLLVVVAGVGMYQLARDVLGADHKWAALVSATAYLYAPYLLTNVFVRGAMAETAAQALLPWIFYGIRRLLRSDDPGRYYLPVTLTLAALAITHNITLLFSPLLLSGFALIHWWQGGRQLRTLRWVLLSVVTAMGISAFFWLPLALERGNIADTGYLIARTSWLPRNVWTWQNFLDRGLTYTHTFARPIRLGLVQALLALLGFALVRRRNAEWLLFGVGAVLLGCLMAAWALPIWLSSDILLIAQFPWRLLSHMSLALALFVGSPLLWLRPGWRQTSAALLLLTIIILAHQPRLNWINVYSALGTNVNLPVLAQLEVGKGALSGGEESSTIQEFRPRWADSRLELA